jgi:HlyD family secretion protein
MCGEGTYTFTLFRSDTESGFSYKLRGIEEGTFPAYTDTPGYLGACGLTIQFGNSSYDTNNTWTIAIPNTESASYVTNLNAYNQARVARDNAIRAAEQALTLAKENARVNTAPPRSEAQIRATETLRQAAARLEAIRARMSEHTITAPFSGIISRIIPVQGESVGSEPAITMIANDDFELIALIPEIDVTRVTSGQKSRVVFDAMQRETLEASVVRVAPLAREINGVSYFEATLVLTNPPAWLRGGLNADIDIVLDSRDAAVRIPKRFLMWESNAAYVLVPAGTRSERLAVDVLFEGNDGFVEVTGIAPGTTVIAP